MLFDMKATSRSPRVEVFRVVAASVTTAATTSSTVLPEGFTRGTVLQTAAGDYTITFNNPFARLPNVHATATSTGSDGLMCHIHTLAVDSVRIVVNNDAGTVTAPTQLHVTAIGFDTADVV